MTTAYTLPHDHLIAPWLISDPGASGTFANGNNGRAICSIKTLAAESRTLGAPDVVGQRFRGFLDTDGGDCTIAITSGQGISSVVLDDAGDYFEVEAISVGGTVKWRLSSSGGVSSGASQDFGADSLTIGGVIQSPYRSVSVSLALNGNCIDQNIFIADRAYQVTRVDYSHATAGSDGSAVNLQLAKQTGTQAIGSGTNLLTNNTNAGFNCKATANTVQNGTLTATTASLQMATGDRLALDFTGTITSLAGVTVTVQLKPI
jgi:hypothetical protein